MNTSAADMDVIAERCRYVYGRSQGRGGAGDSGWGTARGVFHGIRASLGHVFGSDDVVGRRVLVQGTGSVGGELARALAGAGAEVLVSDVEDGRAAAVAAATGARVVPAAAALETSCEVYAPCAVGGTLSSGSIPGLRCRIVAGSANNQLAEPADAERLRTARILYGPVHGCGVHNRGLGSTACHRQGFARRRQRPGFGHGQHTAPGGPGLRRGCARRTGLRPVACHRRHWRPLTQAQQADFVTGLHHALWVCGLTMLAPAIP